MNKLIVVVVLVCVALSSTSKAEKLTGQERRESLERLALGETLVWPEEIDEVVRRLRAEAPDTQSMEEILKQTPVGTSEELEDLKEPAMRFLWSVYFDQPVEYRESLEKLESADIEPTTSDPQLRELLKFSDFMAVCRHVAEEYLEDLHELD